MQQYKHLFTIATTHQIHNTPTVAKCIVLTI